MCFLDDGKLLVSKTHRFSPHVRGFQARLQRMGQKCQVYLVDLSVIEKAYSQAGVTGSKAAVAHSDMQKAAKAIFTRAVEMRASDIHIRVSKKERTAVLFRIHNDLELIEEQSFDYGEKLCSTIYQAMADVSDAVFETLGRQDARISDKSKLPEGIDGIRIATSPQVDGNIMVLRLLYNDTAEDLDLRRLGYEEKQIVDIEMLKRKPTGINIIAGPTGSGKSTTLQRVLGAIIKDSRGRKHIITVEDPPEYPIPGSVQTPVTNSETEEERARAFQASIKSAMRLDPDIIMIGEMRDGASARLAVQAAMTGHQVWSTLHANSAFSIIDRLVDLNVPIELLTDPSIVSGLTCQRLLKVLCPHCKKPILEHMDNYSEADVTRIMTATSLENTFVLGDGCEHCRKSGVLGRTVVAECVVTDQVLMNHLRERDKVSAIKYWKEELGGFSMLEHAIIKINNGTVDPFQAEDVVGPLNMIGIEQELT